MNDQLTSYLNEYLTMQTPQFAVMISGKWGCGKTYYIKNMIDKWYDSDRNISTDSINLKPIYVSLNGLSSISSIIRKVKTVLYPILYSKGATVAKTVILSGKITNNSAYPSVTVTIPSKVYNWTDKQVLIWEGVGSMKPLGAKSTFFK